MNTVCREDFRIGDYASKTIAVLFVFCIFSVATAAESTSFPQAPGPSLLPQSETFMVTLRNWMGTLEEDDLKCQLSPLKRPEDCPDLSREQLFKLYLLVLEPDGSRCFRLPASYFLLSSIENRRDNKIYMGISNGGLSGATRASLWYSLDYQGNPHYRSRPLALRMGVAIATELCVYVHRMEHRSGWRYNRSDAMGGKLLNMALPFYYIRDQLPEAVQEAIGRGLKQIFNAIEDKYPMGNGGGNMESFQAVGMYYVARALKSEALMQRALKRAHYVWGEIETYAGGHLHRHGAPNDGDGAEHTASHATDLSYEGIQQYHFGWAAHLFDDQALTDKVVKSLDIHAHLTFPGPEGPDGTRRYAIPSHFNDATQSGIRQWAGPAQDVGLAALSPVSRYLMWTDFHGRNRIRWDILTNHQKLVNFLNDRIGRLNRGVTEGIYFSRKPYGSGNHTYSAGSNWAALLSSTQWLADFTDTPRHQRRLPVLREENYIRNYGDDIICAKFDTYSVVIHTGAIRNKWATGIPGFGGGALSVFWDPTGGTSLLGCSRGTQGGVHDTWVARKEGFFGWRSWATNHIGGLGNDGRPFSSARNRFPTTNVEVIPKQQATVKVTGRIGQHDHAYSAPNGAIRGDVRYSRRFALTTDGVSVETTLRSDGRDECSELWEFLPIHLEHKSQNEPPATIEYRPTQRDKWSTLGTERVKDVRWIRRRRYQSAVLIRFSRPRAVKLNENVYGANRHRIAVLMVDLHEGKKSMPREVKCAYTILPPNGSAD